MPPLLTPSARLRLAALCLAALALAVSAGPAAAQGAAQDVASAGAHGAVLHDGPLAWRTYASTRQARVRVFASADERRPTTVVVDDEAGNGDPITDDAGFVADLVGRELGFDPVAATFVFRFTPAAFAAGAAENGKTLLLRATFSRSASGGLGAAQWRVLTPDGLDDLTDRAFR